MNNEDIILKSYYDIDLYNKKVEFINCENSEVLNSYITRTVNFVINESTKCQQYKLKRDTNEVYAIIKESFTNHDLERFNKNCKIIANILLESEAKISKGAIEPKSGGLVQALINKDNGFYYVLIKNEFFSAINRMTMEIIEAFLYDEKKKAPLKICIYDVQINNDNEFTLMNIYVDDSIQRNHSVYWYDDFLQLEKCNSNEVNTNNAVESIIKFWEKEIEDPRKFLEIRNDTISFFRSNDFFDLDDYKNNIASRHHFEDEERIFEKLEKLSTKKRKGFDKRFEISQNDIKKRIVTRKFYPLTSKTITLSIEGDIDFNDIFVIEENGKHFVKIRTDDEYTINSLKKTCIKNYA